MLGIYEVINWQHELCQSVLLFRFADSLFGVEAYIGGVLSGFSDQDSLNNVS